ncbi:MAG: hypothetical protein WCK01_03710 [Candidatus Uhrbacteria bacterium]
MTPSKKSKISSAPCKDGHSAPWHIVGWLAAIALVLSASTMSLSASAAATPTNTITPTVLYRSLGDIHAKLNRIEAKIDQLATQCGTSETQCTPPEPVATPAPAPAQEPAPTIPKTPAIDPVLCRQQCEDTFNACKTQITDKLYSDAYNVSYGNCKNTLYYTCYVTCGN